MKTLTQDIAKATTDIDKSFYKIYTTQAAACMLCAIVAEQCGTASTR